MRYAWDTIILKTRSEVKVSDLKMVCDTLSSQDVFTNQNWKDMHQTQCSFWKLGQVKVKVTVTQLWYPTLFHPKMYPHSK